MTEKLVVMSKKIMKYSLEAGYYCNLKPTGMVNETLTDLPC
jgi:hypothetical protein